ncbi:hypothetical protein LPJ81_002320 [Coemansia sp. IMI 209127]|nr:hypothetical protein LPJ81_002320 [Coemansia sp. IMI 209127]
MSSLSYNWQNEFSDLRYQVDQLQKTDPLKYQQLAATLGLKPGQQIDVPSQFDGVWASKFVMGADLYTPPVPTAADTFDPSQATPTGSVASLLSTAGITDSAAVSTQNEESVSTMSGGSVVTLEHSHRSSGGSSDDEGLDSLAASSTSLFQQNGNPIVGMLNTNYSPIVPTGIGYSKAAPQVRISTMHGIVLVGVASLLLF